MSYIELRSLLSPAADGITPATPVAPAIIRGAADGSTFSGIATGVLADATQRAPNGPALQNFLNWCASNGKYAEFPPARYEYDCRTVVGGVNAGLQRPPTIPGLIGGG